MARLSAVTMRLVQELSGRASLCSSLFSAWGRVPVELAVGARELTAAAGLSVSEEPGAEEILHTLARLDLVTPAGERWRPCPGLCTAMPELATAFAAIDQYIAAVHKDDTEVRIVLTRPERSLGLARQLIEAGWRAASADETEDSFRSLVQCASTRIRVMMPFLDEHGATWLRELLAQVPATVDIALILRSLEDPRRSDYPTGFRVLQECLRQRHVKVFNYSIPRREAFGRETFHAKVIVADSEFAYVGSANMTASSLEHSMELGVVLKGRAAREISLVVDAVLKCADPWPL